MDKPIDIFMACYLRQAYTERTITYLYERTKYPFRLFVIDNGGNDEVLSEAWKQGKLYLWLKASINMGIHPVWNIALALAESEYFITTDNDIYVPDLEPDWLSQLVKFIDGRPDYGAISLHPHVFIGAAGIDPKDPEDVKDRNMCGAVMRIMRTDVIRKIGGWEYRIEEGRNHEERWICSRLHDAGYKTGICSRIRAYHPFGKDIAGQSGWGYPPEFPPEKQKHRPELTEEVLRFDNPDAYDNKTWIAK